MSQKQYKQSKLPARFLKGRQRDRIDLTFYLDLEGNARFENNGVPGEKYLFQIKWPDINQLLNVTCHPRVYLETLVGDEDHKNKRTGTGLDLTWSAILKSHLQKNIRRGETDLALATSLILIKEDPIVFLRRLPIIVVEDTYLFRNFPTLVWLMIYFTEYPEQVVSEKWTLWLLSCVKNLCEKTPWLDRGGQQTVFNWKSANVMMKALEIPDRSLVYALQLRRIYGGMTCDQKMLNWFSLVWLKRCFNRKKEEIDRLDREWPLLGDDLDVIPELRFSNFNLAAVDFHPCPRIIHDLHRKYPEFSEELLRSTIWHASSGINFRDSSSEIMPDYQFVWETIYDDWKLLTQRILRSYLN